jgi:hypothetical protein
MTWSDEKNCPRLLSLSPREILRRVWGAELPISEILEAA